MHRIQVGMPGASDRLTDALRRAYGQDHGLPEDMIGLLRKLDRPTDNHR